MLALSRDSLAGNIAPHLTNRRLLVTLQSVKHKQACDLVSFFSFLFFL